MRELPPGLQAHLDTGATTLCWCWRIVRSDGAQFGFTDHDRALGFDGTVYEADAGFTATDIESSVGLGVDNLDAASALRSDSLNEDDLSAGLFDNATIEIYRVNWQDPSQRLLMRSGTLGEVKRGPHAFLAEVRGLAQELQQPKGRLFQFGCDADLGDTRCRVDLGQAGFSASGTVQSVSGSRAMTVTGLDSFATDWFSRGLLTWTSGGNTGRAMEIKVHANTGGVVTVELWQRMSQPVNSGDAFVAKAGCDKQFTTCREKFDNVLNFRGFPHMPGNDFFVSYPNSDDPDNDGGSLFS